MKSRFALFSIILLSCGCQGMGAWVQSEEEVPQSFTVENEPHVIVDTFNGQIEVTTGADKKVEARVTKVGVGKNQEEADDDLDNILVSMTQEKDTVRIKASVAEGLRTGNRAAHVKLQVPAGSILDLKTTNGNVDAVGRLGDIEVRSSNGEISARQATGKLHLVTTNGKIIVEGGAGPLDLETSNGDVDIESDKAIVNARTSNGTVRFRGRPENGDHSLRSTNGSIELALPGNLEFSVDARTSNGSVFSAFAVERSDEGRKTHLKGVVGEGSRINLKLTTTNGAITIRKE
jgi:DUF4097 and DUF4098 domain-containing protein YvlB